MSKRLILVAVVCLILAAGGYLAFSGRESTDGWLAGILPGTSSSTPPAPPAQPPPEVGVVEIHPAEVAFPVEYAGRVASVRDVEVRPLVGGHLLSREFDEGAKVTKGQLLFRIDPAPYQVALSRVEAQHLQAQATLREAEENFRRIEELERRQVATERQRDEALAQRDLARAGVQLAEAEIASARLNLSYTTVNAPSTGVTGLQSPPVGALVQAQQTLLTTITQLDPAYVNFSFTEAEGQAFRDLNQRRETQISERDLTVELHYGTGRVYSHRGRMDTAEQRINPQTGTIEARAVFPNPDGELLPGQFVRIVLQGITIPDAIVIPQRAISQGPQGPSVFVVDGDGTAQARPIRLGSEVSGGQIVRSGLQQGDRVIVDGVIRVRPGAPVRAVPLQRNAATGPTGTDAQAGSRP